MFERQERIPIPSFLVFGCALVTNKILLTFYRILTVVGVLAHDVDDFSKIWQAMGRSRTMNDTIFTVYKSGISADTSTNSNGAVDIKTQQLTRSLYVHNCDCKMAGNISSIYLTLIALYNLSQRQFYYLDEIVNVFLEKMENTILEKVDRHANELAREVLGSIVPARILFHILDAKFRRSSNKSVAGSTLSEPMLEKLLREIVKQKFEQRGPSFDIYDQFVLFLSGEQRSLMEISYTKQQQKQKQKQQNKNQDSDAMGIFHKQNQLKLSFTTDNYFHFSRNSGANGDVAKTALGLPASKPIVTVTYCVGGVRKAINVYPTLQFLYSHHIQGEYMSEDVKERFKRLTSHSATFFARFLQDVETVKAQGTADNNYTGTDNSTKDLFDIQVPVNYVTQHPLYTVAGLQEGVYVIGMKDQFNRFEVQDHPLFEKIQYVFDEMGFILYDKPTERNVNSFGPYFIENYILLEVLSKQEIAKNVMDYYSNHIETIQRGLSSYDEKQGKGFICWRFLINESAKAIAAAKRHSPVDHSGMVDDPQSTPKRRRSGEDEDPDAVADGLARSLDI